MSESYRCREMRALAVSTALRLPSSYGISEPLRNVVHPLLRQNDESRSIGLFSVDYHRSEGSWHWWMDCILHICRDEKRAPVNRVTRTFNREDIGSQKNAAKQKVIRKWLP